MGGCFSKPKPVEVKVEVMVPDKEKEKEKESLSPNGKVSPMPTCKANGSTKHIDERPIAVDLYQNPKDMVEVAVCHVNELQDGQMREVDVASGKALLIKERGEYCAIGYKCPHYGAPLVKGVLTNGRVRCPWHGACFNVATGDIEDFPGLDSLPKFQVRIEKEKVMVRASKQALQLQKRVKWMSRCATLSDSSFSNTSVLIIGSGPAGLVCAETLRQEGFTERIVMCTLETHLPYDRPKLSKSLECQTEQITLRSKDFLSQYDIEVQTDKEVHSVDVKSKVVHFKDGLKMEYNKLLIATGSRPKPLQCQGADLENVYQLRTPEDANCIAKLANDRNAVIVGASFIGMEVAAYLTDKAHSVSVVGIENIPFRKVLGEKVGRSIMKMFETNRVKFYLQNEVSELRGQDGKVKEVVLKSGKILRADVCVVGIGVVPATSFLKQSGINMDSKGFLPVNKLMQTNVPGVFAAGDVVTFPLAFRNNKKVNVGHWQMAHMHGRIAALNILGKGIEINTVPYFWTAMFGKSIRYAGHGEGFDDVIIQGDLDERKFVAFYTKKATGMNNCIQTWRSDEVIAVSSMNYDPIVSKVAEVMQSGRTIKKRDVEMFVRHGWTGDMSWLFGKGT
ncbi:apoptosis-inducing factor 3 isoform X1 [Stegostoma tigrinum]|uniref:apoptosis-inducing factor 3 isoform X1 n=1 Tax=Stegostoma tigrinum TaxID=3053191 RepID=UPI00286FE85B|nr:apoptosis-inducing factor 3 isoform X1 [Stegostoma tigrinum]XP_048412412.2 apoptosis-inducing factor 3 isoform X1 [Stegostoma tigrinum]XP_048412413.2 apoptosis-inducing factor 3 isoform X1 [Stegostoma tigrinum]XP_048412414.2 apoptosis-inducing factor 3 isoform X1 [Stegostoma tigrinum]